MTRLRSARIASLAILAAVWLATGPAIAEDQAAARRLFARGQRAFAAGRYERALEALTAAYDAAPLPGFLYNIALCHRRLEHWTEARDYLQRFLTELPEAPNRPDAETLLQEVNLHIPPEPPPPEPEPPPPEPEPPPVEPSPPPRPVEPAPSGGVSALTWIALLAGAGLAGGTTYFALQLSSLQNDYDALDCARSGARCRTLRDEGEAAALYQNVFGVASGVVLAAAVVMLTLDLTSRPERNEAEDASDLALALVPGGAMARWSW